MTMVDWLLTEQLVDVFREARAARPALNAELEARSVHGEEEILAGAGTAVRIDAVDGAVYLITPRRIARLIDADAIDLVVFPRLIGYDWIAPEMSEKVALKADHFDRLYLYTRDGPPIVLDKLGWAVYPLMTFLGRVLEFQSQKVMLRKLDDDVVELLGRCLLATARGPLFADEELPMLFGRSREALQVVAAMWPRMNLAAPDLRELVAQVIGELVKRADRDPGLWDEWIDATPTRVEASFEVFRRVSSGEV